MAGCGKSWADGPKAIRQIHAEADDMKYAWRTVERMAHELVRSSTRDPATNVHQWQLETPASRDGRAAEH